MTEVLNRSNHRSIEEEFDRNKLEINTELGKLANKKVTYSDRFKNIFKPIKEPINSIIHDGYDYLFSDDQELKAEIEIRAKEEDKINKRREILNKYITQVSKEDAKSALEKVEKQDPRIASLISSIAKDKKDITVVDLIRNDEEMRFAVATYLSDKLDRDISENPSKYPKRIVDNGQKSTNANIYEDNTFTSREYTVLLALSKIDGSFNTKLEDNLSQNDQNGIQLIGQHRYAANVLLGLN